MIAYMCVTCQTALNDLHASQTLLLNCQTLILKFSVCVFEGGGAWGDNNMSSNPLPTVIFLPTALK